MPSGTKARERTDGAAAAIQAKHGDSCFVNQMDPDPVCLTSFGDDSTGPPALPCSRDDALVDNGAAAPKSCLSPLEMRTPTAAGGLLPAGTASITTRTTIDQPSLVLSDRRDRFKDFKPMHHGLQQFLEDEGLTNEIDENSDVRSWWF